MKVEIEPPVSSPYSEDLRKKVIAAVERGEGKTNISRMFNISRNTLSTLDKTEGQTG